MLDAEENRREDHAALVTAGVEVHVLRIRSLADVGTQLGVLAERLGVAWTLGALGAARAATRRAVVPIWRRPWMVLGTPTYGASLLSHLGLTTIPTGLGPYPEVLDEDLVALRCDVVLAPSEPYPFSARQLPELKVFGPVELLDGKDLFWWGARTPGAIARLGDQLGAR